MLNPGSRLGEYAITGGFFILSQIFMFVFAFPNIAADELKFVNDIISPLMPDAATLTKFNDLLAAAQSAVTSLLVALSLLSVLFFGLLLDLIGPTFDVSAWSVFQKNVQKNKEWLPKILDDDFPRYGREVYSYCLDEVFPKDIKSFLSKVRKGLKPFRTLEYLLTAYVLDGASGSQTDWIGEQMRLCHMSRAVSATLLLVVLDFIVLILYYLFVNRSASSVGEAIIALFVFICIIASLVLSNFFAHQAYSRFCMTLFSLLYAQTRRQHEGPIKTGK
jgi:hypothetical protein